MFVIVGKCEKCGSPIFSESFSQTTKGFENAKLTRTCRCFQESYVTYEEVTSGGAEEANQGREAEDEAGQG